jgi:hypothetical protein
MKRGGRAAFITSAGNPTEELVRRAFGSAVVGECWIGVEKDLEMTERATGRI